MPIEKHSFIFEKKQKNTIKKIKDITKSNDIFYCMKRLKEAGYQIGVCSNSIKETVITSLERLEIIEFMDVILSNEDVKLSKPHPAMYHEAMSIIGCYPEEVVVFEDSPKRLLSVYRANTHIVRVKNTKDIYYDNVISKIADISRKNYVMTPKWLDKNLNIVIPMAGEGSRFAREGYLKPKPLIDVAGKPMIKRVVENINIDGQYTFIVRKKHKEKYNLDLLLNNIVDKECNLIEVDHLTEGAACTVLLAKDIINNENPLFIANSDQFVEWNSNEFMYKMQESNLDGGIVFFRDINPKWSFAKINDVGLVVQVAEKNPISNFATVGFYFWKKGSDFVQCAEEMISKNIRVNNEFYICPVYNEAIAKGMKIGVFEADRMWGLGTPEDLKYYLENYGRK